VNPGSYKPLRECLYCHRKPPEVTRLTDEHILALSLGGYPILPKSSCPDCQIVTHKFETILTGNVLLDIRTYLGVRSRRPKDRPTSLPTDIGRVPVHQHPAYLALPDLEYPEILGFPKVFGPSEFRFRIHTKPDTGQRHKALGGVGVPINFNIRALRLTLAKTAHAYAMAELGLNSFQPLLPDLILGRMLNHEWLTGAMPHANRHPERHPKHRNRLPLLYHLIELKRAQSVIGGNFLKCEITLFKPLGMPVYQVIVGTRLISAMNSSETISSFRQDL
jgi:hypothetical protein